MLRVVFFGTPEFAEQILQAMLRESSFRVQAIVTQPDSAKGRSKTPSPSPVKALGKEYGLPIFTPPSIRANIDGFIKSIEPLAPFDIGVVAAFGQILPEQVLALPRLGCINVHASLLPRWRGAAPIQRAILAGDTKSGISLMHMEAGLDTGPVYCTEEVPITEETSFGILHDALAEVGAQMSVEHLPAIARGTMHATPQPAEGVTYAKKITRAETFLDWRQPVVEIHRKVRAFSPVPGALTLFGRKYLKIMGATRGSDDLISPVLPAGTLKAHDETALIQASDGTLIIDELQIEGKRRMKAKEFLQGYRARLPMTLGNPEKEL